MNDLIFAALERGLTMQDVKRMQIGQIVDFCIEYNNRQKRAERPQQREEIRGRRRKATQNDINAFFG